MIFSQIFFLECIKKKTIIQMSSKNILMQNNQEEVQLHQNDRWAYMAQNGDIIEEDAILSETTGKKITIATRRRNERRDPTMYRLQKIRVSSYGTVITSHKTVMCNQRSDAPLVCDQDVNREIDACDNRVGLPRCMAVPEPSETRMMDDVADEVAESPSVQAVDPSSESPSVQVPQASYGITFGPQDWALYKQMEETNGPYAPLMSHHHNVDIDRVRVLQTVTREVWISMKPTDKSWGNDRYREAQAYCTRVLSGDMTIRYKYGEGYSFARKYTPLNKMSAVSRIHLFPDAADYDIVSCHQWILAVVYRKTGKLAGPVPFFDHMVADRAAFIKNTGCTKREIMTMMYSDRGLRPAVVERCRASHGIGAAHTVYKTCEDISRMRKVICEVYRDVITTKNKKNPLGSMLCAVMAFYEAIVIDTFIRTQVVPDHLICNMFDGGLLDGPTLLSPDVETASDEVARITGIDVQIIRKPIETYDEYAVRKGIDCTPFTNWVSNPPLDMPDLISEYRGTKYVRSTMTREQVDWGQIATKTVDNASRYIPSGYVTDLDWENTKLHMILAGMGKGKTTVTRQMVDVWIGMGFRILGVSCKIAHKNGMHENLPEFQDYQGPYGVFKPEYLENKGTWDSDVPKTANLLMCQPQSLHKLGDSLYDIIILDEVHSILQIHTWCGAFTKIAAKNAAKLSVLIRAAKNVLALDACLEYSPLVSSYVQALFPNPGDMMLHRCIGNMLNRKFYISTDVEAWYANLKLAIEKPGTRDPLKEIERDFFGNEMEPHSLVWVSCVTKKATAEVVSFMTSTNGGNMPVDRVIMVTGDSGSIEKQIFAHINKSLGGKWGVVVNGACTVGIDVKLLIDSLFVHAIAGHIGCDAVGLYQSTGRARNLVDTNVMVLTGDTDHEPQSMASISEIAKRIQKDYSSDAAPFADYHLSFNNDSRRSFQTLTERYTCEVINKGISMQDRMASFIEICNSTGFQCYVAIPAAVDEHDQPKNEVDGLLSPDEIEAERVFELVSHFERAMHPTNALTEKDARESVVSRCDDTYTKGVYAAHRLISRFSLCAEDIEAFKSLHTSHRDESKRDAIERFIAITTPERTNLALDDDDECVSLSIVNWTRRLLSMLGANFPYTTSLTLTYPEADDVGLPTEDTPKEDKVLSSLKTLRGRIYILATRIYKAAHPFSSVGVRNTILRKFGARDCDSAWPHMLTSALATCGFCSRSREGVRYLNALVPSKWAAVMKKVATQASVKRMSKAARAKQIAAEKAISNIAYSKLKHAAEQRAVALVEIEQHKLENMARRERQVAYDAIHGTHAEWVASLPVYKQETLDDVVMATDRFSNSEFILSDIEKKNMSAVERAQRKPSSVARAQRRAAQKSRALNAGQTGDAVPVLAPVLAQAHETSSGAVALTPPPVLAHAQEQQAGQLALDISDPNYPGTRKSLIDGLVNYGRLTGDRSARISLSTATQYADRFAAVTVRVPSIVIDGTSRYSASSIAALAVKFDEIVEALERIDELETRKALYVALASIARRVVGLEEVAKQYSDKAVALLLEINTAASNNVNTVAQEKTAIDWEDVLKLEPHFEDPTTAIQKRLAYQLYTKLPPGRLEWRTTKLHVGPITTVPDSGNYVVLAPDGVVTIIMRDYKTSNTEQAYIKTLDPQNEGHRKLLETLHSITQVRSDGDYLFKKRAGKKTDLSTPYAQPQFTKFIIDMFKEATETVLDTKIPVNVDALRHSYATFVHSGSGEGEFMSEADKRDLARDMHHSVSMSSKYRRAPRPSTKDVRPESE